MSLFSSNPCTLTSPLPRTSLGWDIHRKIRGHLRLSSGNAHAMPVKPPSVRSRPLCIKTTGVLPIGPPLSAKKRSCPHAGSACDSQVFILLSHQNPHLGASGPGAVLGALGNSGHPTRDHLPRVHRGYVSVGGSRTCLDINMTSMIYLQLLAWASRCVFPHGPRNKPPVDKYLSGSLS